MPTVATRLLRQTIGGTSGTLDFTASGFGTPVAAVFWISKATALATDTADSCQNLGFTDGTSQFASASYRQDAQATSINKHMARNNACALVLSSSGVSASLDFNSWITDGVRVNVTNGGIGTVYAYCLLIGGSEVSAYVGSVSLSTGSSDITAPGFSVAQVLGLGSDLSFGTVTLPSNDAFQCIGMANNGSSVVQACFASFGLHNVSPTENAAYYDTGAIYRHVNTSGANEKLVLGSFDSSGFTVTYTGSGGTANLAYLALGYSANITGHSAGTLVVPTSTGSKDYTAPGHRPSSVLMLCTNLVNADTHLTNNLTGVRSLGGFDGTSDFSHFNRSRDAAATSEEKNRNAAAAMHMDSHTGSSVYRGAFTAFRDDGWTYNLTTAPTGDRQVLWLAFPAPATIGSGTPTAQQPTGSGSGTVTNQASGAGTITAPSGAGSGTVADLAAGAGTASSPTGSGTGTVTDVASGAGTVTAPSGAGSGTVTNQAAGAGTAPSPVGDGAGTVTNRASGAGSITAPSAGGAGTVGMGGSGAGVVAQPVGAGTGTVGDISASGAGLVAPPVGAGAGTVTNRGTGAGDAASPTGAGTGLLSLPSSGAGSSTTPSGDGTGTVSIPAAGAGVLASPAGGGAGTVSNPAVGAGVAPEATGEGSGTVTNRASGAGDVAPPTAAGAGTVGMQGSGGGTVAQAFGAGVGFVEGGPEVGSDGAGGLSISRETIGLHRVKG